MTTKEKYELIDKSKLNEKLLTILQNMEKSSSNFTDESVNSKIDSALDKIIESIRANKPEAIRTVTEAKKEVKKEKEKAIKKNEGKDFSDKKDTDDKTGLPKKDTLEERKEIIKKESETEKEARDRAKKELDKEKEKAKDEVESQIEKLNRLILEDPALRGFNTGTAATGGGKSTPLIDAERKALPRGSRVSKKGWKNQYGASDGGRKYWENRENRSDRKSPEYETGKPYLAKGGNVYSSDDMYEITMVQDGIELDSKLIRARNKAEARMIFEDMYLDKYQDEFGEFEIKIELAKNKMADGGKVRWQDVYVGDNALVIEENKMGVVVKPYGRRFHLRFPDGSEKTYSAEELEFFKDDEFAKGGYMSDGGETEDERLNMGESVYFKVFNDDGKDGIIKFRNDGSNIIEALIAGDIRGFRPKRYMSYLTKKDLERYLNRDFDFVEEVDEDYVQNILSQEAKNKPSDIIVVKYPYPEIASSPEVVTIIKKGNQVFDYDPENGDFKTISFSLDYEGIDLDDFLEDSVKLPLEKLSPETLQVIEIIKENEDVNTMVDALQSKGLIKNYVELAQGGMMAYGGDVDFNEKMSKMRQSYANLEMLVKGKIASAIGIDDAIRIMENDYAFHPFDLITSAVRSGLIELDEINRDLVYSALMEAENVTEHYRDSGEGIGSSDMTYFTKSVLDGAGYKTGFINNTLKRVDADGNEIEIDRYKMNF